MHALTLHQRLHPPPPPPLPRRRAPVRPPHPDPPRPLQCTRARPTCSYEAATEGDSFILAFSAANDALRFGLAVQQELLEAPWPAALLQAEGCASFWMMPAPAPPRCAGLAGLGHAACDTARLSNCAAPVCREK